ncbi:MAG: response regulator [Nitrospira sp.]
MKRLLFVDDEENVLNGLQRMLRPMREEWDMQFVTSGEEALQALTQAPFDVVVSDMRMPGMDGVTLLKEVQGRFPQIVRIVLSGQSDQTMIQEGRGATHQYLAKPCRPGELKATISRACDLRELLANDELRGLTAGMSSVPTLPLLYRQLTRELAADSPSIQAVSAIISKDLGMTAKILQITNSASAGRGDTVSTAEQAANMLGLDIIQSMVRTGESCSVLSVLGSACLNVERLWAESLETGALARTIAQVEQASPQTIDQAGTAGLLHEIGALVIAGHASERYAQALQLSEDRKLPLWQAEHQIFGCTHAEVGAYLLGLWGISEPMVDAVAYHHAPARHAGGGFSVLTAVHVADHLQSEFSPTEGGGAPAQLDEGYLERLGLTDRVPVWRKVAAVWHKEHANE